MSSFIQGQPTGSYKEFCRARAEFISIPLPRAAFSRCFLSPRPGPSGASGGTGGGCLRGAGSGRGRGGARQQWGGAGRQEEWCGVGGAAGPGRGCAEPQDRGVSGRGRGVGRCGRGAGHSGAAGWSDPVAKPPGGGRRAPQTWDPRLIAQFSRPGLGWTAEVPPPRSPWGCVFHVPPRPRLPRRTW